MMWRRYINTYSNKEHEGFRGYTVHCDKQTEWRSYDLSKRIHLQEVIDEQELFDTLNCIFFKCIKTTDTRTNTDYLYE